MERVVRAVYEGGVLKPQETLGLEERAEVMVSIKEYGTPARSELEKRLRFAGLLAEIRWEEWRDLCGGFDDVPTHKEVKKFLSGRGVSLSRYIVEERRRARY